MKKILTALSLVLISFSCFAQDSKSYEDLIKQSRRARITSTILVATGPVVAAGGIGTLIYGLISKDGGLNGSYYPDRKSYNTEIIVGAAGALVGLGVALSSIAFTNKANELKREARALKLKTSTDRINIPGFQNAYANARIMQYKLSLAIPLGR